MGARTSVVGAPPRPGSLIVANHISWLDILVLGGATGCAFVSKDQLGHSLIHWLADQNHTHLRQPRRAHGRSATRRPRSRRRSNAAAAVAFFPEGTAGPGDRLLPFRPPLFAAANGGQASTSGRSRSTMARRPRTSAGSEKLAWEHPESARAPRHPAGHGRACSSRSPDGDRKQLAGAGAATQIAGTRSASSRRVHSPIGEVQ